jgi:hypothetical protein
MTRLENMTLFLKECEWDAKREPFATVLWHLAQAEREFAEARAQRDALVEAIKTAIINDHDSPSWKIKVAEKALAAVKEEQP